MATPAAETQAKPVTDEQLLLEAKAVRAKLAAGTTELAKMLLRNAKTAGFYSDAQLAEVRGEVDTHNKTFDQFPVRIQAEAGGLTAQRRLVADEMARLMVEDHVFDKYLNKACANLNRSKAALAEDNTELHISSRQFVKIKDGHVRKPPTAAYLVSISAKSRGLK